MTQPSPIQREILAGGRVRLRAAGCTFEYEQIAPDALLVRIVGNDTGQFGTATLDEVRLAMLRARPLQLFIDARDAVGAAVSVSDDWTRFFSNNRADLKRVSVLVGSKVIYLMIAIAQHMSRTGNLIQIYSDAEVFDDQVRHARRAA